MLLLTSIMLVMPLAAPAQSTDTTYVVKSGDTLYSIAQRVGASVRALQAWNDLDSTSLSVGDTLRVRPTRRPESEQHSDNEPSAERDAANDRSRAPLADSLPPVEVDTIASDTGQTPESDTTTDPPEDAELEGERTDRPDGSTWIDLALRTGVSADSLWRWNDRPRSMPDEVRLPTDAVKAGQHTVQEGETLYSIAGEYGVSVRALEAANDIEATDLRIGQELRIPSMQPRLSEAWAAPDTVAVSVFPEAFAGRFTASGARYVPDELVGSHPTLPFDAVVLLSVPLDASPQAGRHVFVRIIDRSVNGPEISEAAAEALSLGETDSVGLRVVWRPDA